MRLGRKPRVATRCETFGLLLLLSILSSLSISSSLLLSLLLLSLSLLSLLLLLLLLLLSLFGLPAGVADKSVVNQKARIVICLLIFDSFVIFKHNIITKAIKRRSVVLFLHRFSRTCLALKGFTETNRRRYIDQQLETLASRPLWLPLTQTNAFRFRLKTIIVKLIFKYLSSILLLLLLLLLSLFSIFPDY